MQERIGPYRVEEQLGAGGMGEVYKAYDDRLERWVAIKRIRGDKDEAEENRERFQREARATAKLNHTSIVHLYDIFQDGDSDCIVMEYVEGVTLDRLIRHGPLDPARVASLGHEIASGLAEAHAKGIIHRDLKVENVIVTPDGHAKILDFGLARPLLQNELDASLTGKGQLVGTSRAMSPEYVGGEEIDHRSDLFSLGVLLYEAATSHSPFKAHNTLATLKQVMLHRQTPAHLVNSQVPEELSSLIEDLLRKDPAERPQSAQDVAREFGRITGQLSSGDVSRPMIGSTFTTTPTEVFTPTPTSYDLWGRRRWTVIAAVLIAGVAATFALTRWWMGGPQEVPEPSPATGREFETRDRIVLADFQNHTGEPLLDDTIALAFRLGLEQSRQTYVLPQSQIRGALERMERDPGTPVDRDLGLEIGQREGARALVIGALGKIGETYSLSAEVVAPHSGITTFSTKESAPNQNAIFAALETVTRAIRLNLGESMATIEKTQPLEKVTTRNLEALKAYSLGVRKTAEEQDEAAIQLLKQAIEIDPEFAMAHAKLASVYIYLRRDRATTLAHLDQALRLSDRLTPIEKLYVEGWAARLQGDPDAVIQTWTLMSTLYPEDYVGHHNLGWSYWNYREQFEEAALAFQAAARVAPPETLQQVLFALAYCQIALGQYEEALASLEKVSGPAKRLALTDLYIARGDCPKATSLLQESVAEPSAVAKIKSRLRLAQCHAGEAGFAAALGQAREARRLAMEAGLDDWNLASQVTIIAIQEQIPEGADFEAALASGTAAARGLMEVSHEPESAPVSVLALVGKLSARNQAVDNAEAIFAWIAPLARETPLPVWQGYIRMLEGEILAARGEFPEAVARLKEAIALVDLFQAHESLARALAAAGQAEEAIGEYEWLLEHRGRGVVECLDQCQALAVVDWSLSFYRLGLLHEQLGARDKAAGYYRRFLAEWPQSDRLLVWRDAKRRLAAIHPGAQPAGAQPAAFRGTKG